MEKKRVTIELDFITNRKLTDDIIYEELLGMEILYNTHGKDRVHFLSFKGLDGVTKDGWIN